MTGLFRRWWGRGRDRSAEPDGWHADGRAIHVVVVLTAMAVEYKAVREGLRNLCRRRDPAGTIFEVGELSDWPGAVVAIAETGRGNKPAALAAEQAIKLFGPHAIAVLFSGVAGALKSDLQLGDVVVATKVHYYHGGREGPEGFLARPEGWQASYALEQSARELARTWSWDGQPESCTQDELPRIHFEAIAAGETVLDSQNAELRELIHHHYNDAAAIEMESAGVAEAAHRNQCPHLTIRGISDPADGNKQSADKAGWQVEAANNAAKFTLAVAGAILRAEEWQPADPEVDPPRWHTSVPAFLFLLGCPVLLLEALAWSEMSKGDASAVTIAVLTLLGMLFAAVRLVASMVSYLGRQRFHLASIKPAGDLFDRYFKWQIVAVLFGVLVWSWYDTQRGLWPVPTYLGDTTLLVYLIVRTIREEWKQEKKREDQWPRRRRPVSKVSASAVHEELRRVRGKIGEINSGKCDEPVKLRSMVSWALDELAETRAELTRVAESPRRRALADPPIWISDADAELVGLVYIALGLVALPGFWIVDLYRTADPFWLAVIKLILITVIYAGLILLAFELKYRYRRWGARRLADEICAEVKELRDRLQLTYVAGMKVRVSGAGGHVR